MACTLLLADASLTIKRLVELTFAAGGMTTMAVSNGVEAMARIAAVKPDIVLADAGMRAPGGYDIAAFVKGRPDLSHIPVVLLADAFQPIDPAGAAHCDAVVTKPFQLEELTARVAALLGADLGVPDVAADVAAPAADGTETGDASPPPPSEARLDATDAGSDSSAPPGTPSLANNGQWLIDYFDKVDEAANRAFEARDRRRATATAPGWSVASAREDCRGPADQRPEAACHGEGAGASTDGPASTALSKDADAASDVVRTFLTLLQLQAAGSQELYEDVVRRLRAGSGGGDVGTPHD